MLTRTLQFFGIRKSLRIPYEDMSEVLRFEKRRHKADGVPCKMEVDTVLDSEAVSRNYVLFLKYQGQHVVYKGVSVEPGKPVVTGRRYEL